MANAGGTMKSKANNELNPQQPEIRLRVTVDLTLEELYMALGGLLHMADRLSNGSYTSNAHKLKAKEYEALARRFDREYIHLYFERNPAEARKLDEFSRSKVTLAT